MKDQVAIIGVGCTKFGDQFDQSYEDLVFDAAQAAYGAAKTAVATILRRGLMGRPLR